MSKRDSVTLIDNRTGKQIELDLYKPTSGPMTVDVRSLYKELGYFTYDPGFMSTASCESKITYLDGDKGILEYRGYPIEQLAEESSFLETCYLLLNGELPNEKELAEFEESIRSRSMLQEQLKTFFSGFRRDAHPMAKWSALSAHYLLFITKMKTYMMRKIEWMLRIDSSQKCQQSQPGVIAIQGGCHLYIRKTL